METESPLITITTDFGTEDAYVPAMRGTMLSICPDAQLVDITHEISPQDVMEAAFVLQSAVPYFPGGTVHLVVVDPGVGTDRRAVALRYGDHWFVGADNGLFPLAMDQRAPDAAVELDDPSFWRSETPSTTFHGRDIFAPAAAHLAAGTSVHDLGSPVDRLEPLHWAQPTVSAHTVQGRIVHVDHFGNCITNIRRSTLARALDRDTGPPFPDAFPSMRAYVGAQTVGRLEKTYGTVPEGDPLLLFGSTDLLEIGVNSGSAADLLSLQKGDSVKVVLDDSN